MLEITFFKNKPEVITCWKSSYEWTFFNRDKTYFNNLDFDTAEGESDDSIEFLKDNLDDYLDHNYLDFTKVAAKFFEINEVVDNIKFIDKYGYFKVYRKEFEKNYTSLSRGE